MHCGCSISSASVACYWMLALVSFQLSCMYLLSLKINREQIKKELVFVVPFILKKKKIHLCLLMMREVSREASLGDKIRFVLLISIRNHFFSFRKPWMLHSHSHLNRGIIFQGIVLFTADVALCYSLDLQTSQGFWEFSWDLREKYVRLATTGCVCTAGVAVQVDRSTWGACTFQSGVKGTLPGVCW